MTIETTNLDTKAKELALSPAEQRNQLANQLILDCKTQGVYPASISRVYQAFANKGISGFTVPAINLRGLTYDIARVIWRTALELDAGPILFELAPVEASTGDQTFMEYTAMVLAAAVREGYQGPVFMQGDHFQVSSSDPKELQSLQDLCQQAVDAGFYQIDIDGSHLYDLKAPNKQGFHRPNAVITSTLTDFIRSIQPTDVNIAIGGEVGEIGGRNTTTDDVEAFLNVYQDLLKDNQDGIIKISAQTGTTHGGIVKKDGSVGAMPFNCELAQELSEKARDDFGIGGLVQHGASTLSLEDLSDLPNLGVIEVHLATGIQNVVFDHPAFPEELLQTMKEKLVPQQTGPEGDSPAAAGDETFEQRFYHARWTAWGTFKKELWAIPESNKAKIEKDLHIWFANLFNALKISEKKSVLQELYS